MRPAHLTVILSLILIFAVTGAGAEQDYALKFKNSEFIPSLTVDLAAKSQRLANQHVIIQFDDHIDEATKEQLASEGVKILDYVPHMAYTAKLEQPIDQAVLDSYGIRWMGQMEPAQKISGLLQRTGIRDWARRGDDRAQFTIILHRDVDATQFAEILRDRFSAEILGFEPTSNAIDLIVPEPAYYRLAELDEVNWVQQANPPPKTHNDKARANIGTEIVQGAPYSLTGIGTTVGVWDVGTADGNHPDLYGRVIFPSDTRLEFHPTHVSGIVAANGVGSEGKYRGMAPQARIVSQSAWSTGSEAYSEYLTAGQMYRARTSNNSWGVGYSVDEETCDEVMGLYAPECVTLDNIVRGQGGPAWVICWSAGNERSHGSNYCGSLGWEYRTVDAFGTAKNVIAVGAIDPESDQVTSFSSWGPCQDGRIKPDVVAPGCMISTAPGSGYGSACGTSMASPAVAGTVTLLRQQAEVLYPYGDLMPSTYRAILINTATDLGRLGPDFEYGYGKIQAIPALQRIIGGDSSFIQTASVAGDTTYFDLTIPANSDELEVTIAWDDMGALSFVGPAIVNDLDLILIDPFGQEHLPWVLDPENPSVDATRGEDHINVVEAVSVFDPYPGLWQARVVGYNVPGGYQQYTIVFTPNAIHTPGNQAALAVFSPDDTEADPGTQSLVEFWVTNVGTFADSVTVHIEDTHGWIDGTVDAELFLNQYDSGYFSVVATVPGTALAWDASNITCTLTSKTDGSITSVGLVTVGATAYYDAAVDFPGSATVTSPEVLSLNVTVQNSGNDYDRFVVSISDEMGWDFFPGSFGAELAPGEDTTFNFALTVLAEEPHQSENPITIDVGSIGGVAQQSIPILTVHNPYPPPQLLSPETGIYGQNRTPSFTWEALAGDSYTLYVANDDKILDVVRTFSGLPDPTFTIPAESELADGGYYWAVRRYINADSSSIQRYPRQLIVDNLAPDGAHPVSPMNNSYVPGTLFTFYFGYGAQINSSGGPKAPEYYEIKVSNDSTFTSEVYNYSTNEGPGLIIQDTLNEGVGFWMIRRADSAGNAAPWSSVARFRMETEAPIVPILLVPGNGASAGGLTLKLRWETDEPAPWDESPESYFLQFATDGQFYTPFYTASTDSTSISLSREVFEGVSTCYWRIRASDSLGHSSGFQVSPYSFNWLGLVCGDPNGSGTVNISDVTYLVNYLFGLPGGPEPVPTTRAGSANGDQNVNISDVVYLVDYLFGVPSGPVPICE